MEAPSTEPVLGSRLNGTWRYFNPGMLIAALLAANGIAGAWTVAMGTPGVDFYHYWVVPQAVRSGKYPNVYSAECRRRIGFDYGSRAHEMKVSAREQAAAVLSYKADERSLETVATPFLFTVFGESATGNYDRDYARFVALSLGSYVLAIFIMGRLFGFEMGWILALIALLTRWFEPFESELRVGNVNSLQLAALALFLWLQSKSRWPSSDLLAGLVLGVAALFKPVLLPVVCAVVVVQLAGRRFEQCARMVGGATIGALVGFLWSGMYFGTARCWSQWLGALREVLGSGRRVEEGNLGLARLSFELAGVDLSVALLVTAVSVFVAALWFGRRRHLAVRRTRDSEIVSATPDKLSRTLLGIGSGICVTLLSSRLVWYHYYILLLPALMYYLRPTAPAAGISGRRSLERVSAAAVVFLLTPLAHLLVQEASPHLHPVLVSLTAAVAFLLCLFDARDIPGKNVLQEASPTAGEYT